MRAVSNARKKQAVFFQCLEMFFSFASSRLCGQKIYSLNAERQDKYFMVQSLKRPMDVTILKVSVLITVNE